MRKVATFQLTNDTAAPFIAGEWAGWSCWPGVKGDFPSGSAPIFRLPAVPGGRVITIPYSQGCQANRDYPGSDNSLQNAANILRPPVGLNPGAALSVDVWDSGRPPVSGNRTIDEIYAEGIQINLRGLGAAFGLAGNWVAQCTPNANLLSVNKWLDGHDIVYEFMANFVPADGNFVPTSSVSHGHLVAEFWVMALSDKAGKLGGFLCNPCALQLWWDINTPVKTPRMFAPQPNGVAWQHGAGSAKTIVSMVWPSGWVSRDFKATAGSNIVNTTTTNDYYQGYGGDNTKVPGYLTTTGTLPAPLFTMTRYWARAIKNSMAMSFALNPEADGGIQLTSAGVGTHTFNPAPILQHFGRMFMPTADDVRWNYFQGAGSMASFGQSRISVDRAYWTKSDIIPNYDLSLVGTVTAASIEPSFPSNFKWPWNPYTIGPMTTDRAGTGGRLDIGPINGYSVCDFYVQSANTDKVTRLIGYATANDLKCLYSSVTKQLPNLKNGVYVGFAAPSAQQQRMSWDASGGVAGFFTGPGSTNLEVTFNQGTNAHRALYWYWAFLKTGEPQFLKMGTEIAQGGVIPFPAAVRNPTSLSVPYYGVCTYWQQGAAMRNLAWPCRDIELVAAVYPNISPDKSEKRRYFADFADDNWRAALDNFDNRLPAYYQGIGFWTTFVPSGHPSLAGSPFSAIGAFCMELNFCNHYMYSVWLMSYAMRENADAKRLLELLAKFWQHKVQKYGFYSLVSFQNRNLRVINLPGGDIGYPAITSDDEYAIDGPMVGYAWNGAGDAGHTWSAKYGFSHPGSFPNFVPHDGDYLYFPSMNNVPQAPSNYVIDHQKYFLINVTHAGNTASSTAAFDLTTVKGSQSDIVTPAGTGTVDGKMSGLFYMASVDFPSLPGYVNTGANGADTYQSQIYFLANGMQHNGITAPPGSPTLTDIANDQSGRFLHAGFKAVPTWAQVP